MRKFMRPAMLAVVIAASATLAAAQSVRYPSRTIEIVVAYGAGGSTDLVARALGQKFQERLGQPVVVLNKPGGSGTIGATLAALPAAIAFSALSVPSTFSALSVPSR